MMNVMEPPPRRTGSKLAFAIDVSPDAEPPRATLGRLVVPKPPSGRPAAREIKRLNQVGRGLKTKEGAGEAILQLQQVAASGRDAISLLGAFDRKLPEMHKMSPTHSSQLAEVLRLRQKYCVRTSLAAATAIDGLVRTREAHDDAVDELRRLEAQLDDLRTRRQIDSERVMAALEEDDVECRIRFRLECAARMAPDADMTERTRSFARARVRARAPS